MKPMSRRTFARNMTLLAGAGLLPFQAGCRRKAASSLIEDVQIGVQSYSFRDRSFEDAIEAMVSVGIDSCELWQGHLEPRGLDRDQLRRWRLETPLSFFENAARKLDRAGIRLNAYNYSFRKTMSPEEIDRGFLMARALGTEVITASARPSLAPLIDSFASKHRIRVGMHNHAHGGKEDVFDGPQDFAAAMDGASPYICVNLDIEHEIKGQPAMEGVKESLEYCRKALT